MYRKLHQLILLHSTINMTYLKFSQVAVLIILPFFVFECGGHYVQFYEEPDFKGDVLFEVNTSRVCTNAPVKPDGSVYLPGSVKTSGCIALNILENCHYRTHVVTQSSVSNLEDYLLYAQNDYRSILGVRSLVSCTELEERLQTDIDIYQHSDGVTNISWENGVLVEYKISLSDSDSYTYKKLQFRDICSCANYETTKDWVAIYIHGNCFNFYETENCVGNPTYISDKHSTELFMRGPKGSLEPCKLSKTCTKLKISIFNFVPIFDESNLRGSTNDKSITAGRTFFNNGTATINQAYTVEHKVSDTAEIEISKSFREMQSMVKSSQVGFEESSENTNEKGWNATGKLGLASGPAKVEASGGYHSNSYNKVESKLKNMLTTSSKGEDESRKSNSSVERVETEMTYTVQSTLIVPPCTKYEVRSVIKVAEGVTIIYHMYFKISGERLDGTKLTSEDIREIIGEKFKQRELTFFEDHDEWDDYTAIAAVKLRLKLTYGVDAVLDGEGEVLQDCLLRHKQSICKATA